MIGASRTACRPLDIAITRADQGVSLGRLQRMRQGSNANSRFRENNDREPRPDKRTRLALKALSRSCATRHASAIRA